MPQWPVYLIHRSVDNTIKWVVLMRLKRKNLIQEEIVVKEVKISTDKILHRQKISSTSCSSDKNHKIVVKEGRTIASNKEIISLRNKMKLN